MAKKRNITSASVFKRSGIRAIRARAIKVLVYCKSLPSIFMYVSQYTVVPAGSVAMYIATCCPRVRLSPGLGPDRRTTVTLGLLSYTVGVSQVATPSVCPASTYTVSRGTQLILGVWISETKRVLRLILNSH